MFKDLSARGVTPHNTVLYAIGDIHGCSRALADLLQKIEEDSWNTAKNPIAVFLGDYVDRGPNARGVLQQLAERPLAGFVRRFLLGNHDRYMRAFLEDASIGPWWAARGGRSTLHSYGVEAPGLRVEDAAWDDVWIKFKRAVPTAHVDFLNSLEPYASYGGYCFVHAGLRFGAPLAKQTLDDLTTIRRPFLQGGQQFAQVVVHGHTPSRKPYLDQRRLGVDTGAYLTRVLTAARLEGDDVSFLSSHEPPFV